MPPKTEWTITQLAAIRETLLDVIDDGAPWQGLGRPWTFYPTEGYWKTETQATNADRLDFCSELQRRLMQRSE